MTGRADARIPVAHAIGPFAVELPPPDADRGDDMQTRSERSRRAPIHRPDRPGQRCRLCLAGDGAAAGTHWSKWGRDAAGATGRDWL